MNVLWLSHNLPYPPVQGVRLRNYNLIREAARHTTLHLVALRQHAHQQSDADRDKAIDHLRQFCASVHVFEIDWETGARGRLRQMRNLALGGVPYDIARYHSTGCHAHLASLSASDFDALHVDTLGLIPYRRHLAGVPAVLNHHNVESHMLQRRADGEPRPHMRIAMHLLAKRLERWERRFCPTFPRNLVVSVLDGERLGVIAPGTKTTVIPNGVDTEYFDCPINVDPSCKRVLWVGPESQYANRDAVRYLLTEIWPLISAHEPDAELILIGGSVSQETKAAAAADPRIKPLGFVEDIRPESTRAAVAVCPMRQGGGTRLKVLNTLSMRKAMVCTTMGAEGVPVEDGVHYLRADTAAGFAERVVELLREPGRRGALGEAARQLMIDQFDWARIGKALCDVYAEIQPEVTPQE